MWVFEILLVIYGLKLIVWVLLQLQIKRFPKEVKTSGQKSMPSVDIILPMYNEENVIVNTLNNLLKVAYSNLSIIIVDDGSTDRSLSLVNSHFSGQPRVRILHQSNKGKSSALNNATNSSQSDIIVCIDADTIVRPDVIDIIVPYFQDPKVASVSGYVKVGNRMNLITEMQYAEYVAIQNYDRILFEPLNGILVVPGALGAFRRSAVLAVGGFTTDTLAEDCDITIRMLCSNYSIRNAASAIAYTEAPATAEMFFKQRARWTVGLIQGLVKHGRQLFEQRNKALACIVVPYTWVYRVILPVFLVMADYFAIYSVLLLGKYSWLQYYLIFFLMDVLTNYFILSRAKERLGILKLIILQRIYRHLTCFTFLYVIMKYWKGNVQGWIKIPRQGNMELE
jgi:cellulose synthase/poly-beta-1,6-N-acetylglucosamine synthase-like glycosyltransferase